MSTIHLPTLEVGQYFKGDLHCVRCSEPDPIEDWPRFAEDNAHDLRSIRLDGELIGCMGYFMRSLTEADAFSAIDREACRGVGKRLALAMRERQLQWMEDLSIVRVWADCPLSDRKAQAFLRAIGYKRIIGESPDTAFLYSTGDDEMSKGLRKFGDPLKLPDPLDLWGEKAAKAQKDAKEQAQLDREALAATKEVAPNMQSDEVSAAREAERQRKLALSGQGGTILTGPSGIAATNNTSAKTLLGS